MRWAASDVSPSSHLAFHIPTLAGFLSSVCFVFVCCFIVFLFPVLQVSWEGSGARPARWERPFYQGAQIYAPLECPVQPGFVRRSNPGEPKFGGEAGLDLAVKRGKDATWQ